MGRFETILWDSGPGVISSQLLQEFFVNVVQKIPKPIDKQQTKENVRDYLRGMLLATLVIPSFFYFSMAVNPERATSMIFSSPISPMKLSITWEVPATCTTHTSLF